MGAYDALGEGLRAFAENRVEEQRLTFRNDLLAADQQKRGDLLMEWCLALFVEVGEMSNEAGWKPWVAPGARGLLTDKFVDEAADVVIFLGNVLAVASVLGVTGEDVAAAVQRKTMVNRERQATNYRGRT